MDDTRPHELLIAIEKLINAKLIDAIGRPDGLTRLVAHRTSGVVSPSIRCAEQELEKTLSRCLHETSANH